MMGAEGKGAWRIDGSGTWAEGEPPSEISLSRGDGTSATYRLYDSEVSELPENAMQGLEYYISMAAAILAANGYEHSAEIRIDQGLIGRRHATITSASWTKPTLKVRFDF